MYEKLLSLSPVWVEYAVKRQLLGSAPDTLEDLKTEVLSDPLIRCYLGDLTAFHNKIVRNHKDPTLAVYKLLFLLDLGLTGEIPEIKQALQAIRLHRDQNGVYQSLTNIPTHFGGSGKDVFGWCLCDAPVLLRALVMAKADFTEDIQPGLTYLLGWQRSNGFPCGASPEFGSFRGPGRKADACPLATLNMLKLLSELPQYRNSEAAKNGVEALLALWENSQEAHPYMFYMGTDFRKLKAPTFWYDILSVTEALSNFDYVKSDPRFMEMVRIIKDKQDDDGLYTAQSVYQKAAEWDFGQKKKVSAYLSFLCLRVLKRAAD